MPRRLIHRARHRLAHSVDSALIAAALTPSARSKDVVESLGHRERMGGMAAIAAFYDRPEFIDPAGPFFTRLPSLEPEQRRVRRYGKDGAIVDLRWRSGFQPLWTQAAAEARFVELFQPDSPLSTTERAQLVQAVDMAFSNDSSAGMGGRYPQIDPNSTMHARWFRHDDGPRPTVVILHGFMGGHLALEERMWPIRRLYAHGIDVLLTVLPLHGPRTDPRRRFKQPDFPGADPRSAVEGFRHMVHDHLTLFDYLLDGRAQQLGVVGMSLGGYSAALLATLDPRLRLAVFDMPLASIPDIALRTGRMIGSDIEKALQVRALHRTYRTISPLSRPSLLPADRALVVAGSADQVTGLAHGEALAAHFEARTSVFAGSHLLPLGRLTAQAPMWELLRSAGFTS